jgi:oxalate decarboxylase/phosphoglucose isomerase-like protein (cupin superfamily)
MILEGRNSKYLKTVITIAILMFLSEIIMAQTAGTNNRQPQPKLITLNLDSTSYQEIFEGPPATVGMYSGLVTIKPGETVGHHNTENYEEMLVIYSGEGEMIFTDRKIFKLKYGIVAYCPPHTEHDVKNTGPVPLKYIYIASKTIQ